MSLTIPYSTFLQFNKRHPELRFGQEFYQFMRFDRITNPEDVRWLDKLYNEPNTRKAVEILIDHMDWNN